MVTKQRLKHEKKGLQDALDQSNHAIESKIVDLKQQVRTHERELEPLNQRTQHQSGVVR